MLTPAVTICSIDYPQTYPLRHAVLWPDKPLGYIKIDEDSTGHHFGAFLGNELVAVISLFISDDIGRFRKFAAHPTYQRMGIGTQLLHCVIAEARRFGAVRLWCDARLDAADFYRKFGMQQQGDVFHKGIIPYATMSKPLR